MELRTNDPIVSILGDLYDRLDFHTREEDNRSPYNKAYSILSDEIELNGIPTTERAYHLLLVGGIKEKNNENDERNRGIVINSANFSKEIYGINDVKEMTKDGSIIIVDDQREKKVNKLTALNAMLALGLGGRGFGGLGRKATKAPKKPNMNLTEEETLKLSQLAGREKKQFVKELKAKYN